MRRNNTRPIFVPFGDATVDPLNLQTSGAARLWQSYKMRMRRRRFLVRAIRKRRELSVAQDRTGQIAPGAHLLIATLRNERHRLPHFLDYYRALGVDHFLIVVNESSDGTADYLADQVDVSVWCTDSGYKAARFGMDWVNWLLFRHGHGHWCLTVDADELFVYPQCDTRPLPWLTDRLEAAGQEMFGALMVDLYPKGPIDQGTYQPGQDPVEALPYFDTDTYRACYRADYEYLWVQGGPRDRVFFADSPERAPTLSKVPLVKWSRRYVYVSSTHTALPCRLNHVWDGPTGALMHTKFLPGIIDRSREERARQEHFANDQSRQRYYDGVTTAPDMWRNGSVRYTGWPQLLDLGLISDGDLPD